MSAETALKWTEGRGSDDDPFRSEHFVVQAYPVDGGTSDLLVSEIGKYSGEPTLGDGPIVVTVKADGAWSGTASAAATVPNGDHASDQQLGSAEIWRWRIGAYGNGPAAKVEMQTASRSGTATGLGHQPLFPANTCRPTCRHQTRGS